MVHMLASLAFTLAALGAFAVIAFSLALERDKIAVALGLRAQSAVPAMPRRPVRIRSAGRWQSVTAPAATAPRRAAA
jgi:hypothetical protein